MTAGSMPLAREIYQEGLRIPPALLYQNGKRVEAMWSLILANVRTPEEREGDLSAQVAALVTGQRRLAELVERNGEAAVSTAMAQLLRYADRLVRAGIRRIPNGSHEAEDVMDDDGLGTLVFVAPEIILRDPYNKAVDIWSLGVTLYNILFNEFPFDDPDENDEKIALQIVNNPVPFKESKCKEVSKEVVDLLKKCLRKDPNKRIGVEKILAHDWFKKFINFEENEEEEERNLNILVEEGEKGVEFKLCKKGST